MSHPVVCEQDAAGSACGDERVPNPPEYWEIEGEAATIAVSLDSPTGGLACYVASTHRWNRHRRRSAPAP